MAAEFVIAGRRELPGGDAPWQLRLESDEGSIVVYTPQSDDYRAHVARVVGFEPRTIVMVRKAWDCAQVVAEVLAEAIDGYVYCDFGNDLVFDAAGTHVPYGSRDELAAAMRAAFCNPAPYFERWEQAAKAAFSERLKLDPVLAAENDWSEI
jgi:hypothetical protein